MVNGLEKILEEVSERETLIMNELAVAVYAGDRERVFQVAMRLVPEDPAAVSKPHRETKCSTR